MFGDAPPGSSEVEVRLTRITDDETALELAHAAVVPPEMWDRYGPGAVGVGWDLTVLGLSRHLDSGADMSTEDKEAWGRSDEGRDFMSGSADAWRVAHEASGVPATTPPPPWASTCRIKEGALLHAFCIGRTPC
jgi:hypothetical protein